MVPPGEVSPPDVAEDEFQLRAPEGLSEKERLDRTRQLPPVSPRTEPPRRQFSLASLLVVTFFVSLGLAGQNWLPPVIYAGLLGLMVIGAMFWVIISPPETAGEKLVWWGLNVAYITAILVAVARQFVG